MARKAVVQHKNTISFEPGQFGWNRATQLVLLFVLCGGPAASFAQDLDADLLYASSTGNVELLKTALKAGADPNVSDSSGTTALIWSTFLGATDAVRVLLENGADPLRNGAIWLNEERTAYYGSALAAAAGEGWIDVVRLLISDGHVPIDQKEYNPSDGTASGWTALQWAVSSDQEDVVAYLAEQGADVDIRNPNGESPLLTIAHDAGKLQMIRTLLEAGADPNLTDSSGNSAILYAMGAEALEVVALLIDYGADLNAVGTDSATPLLFGISTYSTASTLYLLDQGVNVDPVDHNGMQPLHWAAMAGVPEVVEKLIDRGADPNVRNPDGTTPLIMAAQTDRTRAARTLIERGADPNLAERGGWTPLVYAASNGNGELMRLLIDSGADVDHRTDFGTRAIDIAIDSLVMPPVEQLMCAGSSLDLLDPDDRTPLERARVREIEEAQRLDYMDEPNTWLSESLADPYCGAVIRTGIVANSELFMAAGSFVAARQVYETFLDQERARLGEQQEGYAYILANSLWTRVESGDTEEGISTGREALRLYEKLFQSDSPDMAQVLSPLAALYARKIPAQAWVHVERGLAVTEADDPDGLRPRLLRTRSKLLLNEGRAMEARSDLEDAVELLEETKDSLSARVFLREMARTDQLLAEAELQLGNVDEAGALLRRAIDRSEEKLHSTYASSILADYARYLIQYSPEDVDDAFSVADRSAAIVSEFLDLNFTGMSQAELSAFLENESYPLFGILLSAAQTDAEFHAAYAYLHAQKGLLMQALRVQAATISQSEDWTQSGTIYSLRELRRMIAEESLLDSSNRNTRLDSLTIRKEAVERSLLKNRLRLIDPVSDSTLADFQSSFDRNELLIDLYRYNRQEKDGSRPAYGAAIVANTGLPISWVDLGPAEELEVALNDWLTAVRRGGLAEPELQTLAETLWMPIAGKLPDGIAHIWISPDGLLARLPWTVLSESDQSTRRAQLAVVDSPRELARLRMTQRQTLGRVNESGLLLVGDVNFGETGTGDRGPSLFDALPGTAAELDRILSLARTQRRPVHVAAGRDASRAVVTSRLTNVRYAHIATHGFFFRENESAYRSRGAKAKRKTANQGQSRNPLVESGLALAGANEGSEGLLTAEELIGMDMSGTELMVLSACDTGRGTEITGQGVMGLRAALTAAGVRSLLMSLWKVPDESTALLMEAFYRGILVQGLSPAVALGNAQAFVKRNPLYEAPVHWAAWVLAGEVW